MSDTIRKDRYNKPVRDGTDKMELKNKKNIKRSTKKLKKLCAMDKWDVPNHDKHGRIAP